MKIAALFTLKLQSPNREAGVPAGSAIAGSNRWMRLAQNVLLVLMLAGIVYYFAHGFEEREKGTDFPDRYAAARMVREGFGRQLYDFHEQERFQIRYAGRIGEYYIHPPFSQYLAEHPGISRWARLGLLSSQCVLFLPVLATFACHLAGPARVRVPHHSDSDHFFAHIC